MFKVIMNFLTASIVWNEEYPWFGTENQLTQKIMLVISFGVYIFAAFFFAKVWRENSFVSFQLKQETEEKNLTEQLDQKLFEAIPGKYLVIQQQNKFDSECSQIVGISAELKQMLLHLQTLADDACT